MTSTPPESAPAAAPETAPAAPAKKRVARAPAPAAPEKKKGARAPAPVAAPARTSEPAPAPAPVAAAPAPADSGPFGDLTGMEFETDSEAEQGDDDEYYEDEISDEIVDNLPPIPGPSVAALNAKLLEMESKYFDLVGYARSRLKRKRAKIAKKYPAETKEFRKSPDFTHGFNSGMLAATRLYASYVCDLAPSFQNLVSQAPYIFDAPKRADRTAALTSAVRELRETEIETGLSEFPFLDT
jgi:hypothetical protein